MDLEGIGYSAAWKSLQPQNDCTCADHYSSYFSNSLRLCAKIYFENINKKNAQKQSRNKNILCFSLPTSADIDIDTVPLETGTKR